MKQGVIIKSHYGTRFADVSEFSQAIIHDAGIQCLLISYPINESQYEMDAIREGMKYYDEFIVIQDSCLIKNPDILKEMLALKGQSVWLSSWGQNYFCKYRTEILKQMQLPEIKSKEDSVRYEREFHEAYRKLETPIVLMDGCLENTNEFEYAFGRNNMIIENKYFKKYKGTWDVNMIK